MPAPILLIAAAGGTGILAWTILNHDEETQIQRGRAALRTLLNRAAKARKAGGELTGPDSIIHNAMYVRGIGKIDFRWGEWDKEYGVGAGISKVIGSQKMKRDYYKSHVFTQRFVIRIPDILARGKPSKVGNTRLKVTHNKNFVFLEKDYKGQPTDNWVMNAYQEVPPGMRKSTKKIATELRKQKLANAIKQSKAQKKKTRRP